MGTRARVLPWDRIALDQIRISVLSRIIFGWLFCAILFAVGVTEWKLELRDLGV